MSEELSLQSLQSEIEKLQAEVALLRAKVEAKPAKHAAPKTEGVPEDVAMIIAAAVAAFLGKRATIRLIRPAVGTIPDGWRVQGRAAIQGSHRTR